MTLAVEVVRWDEAAAELAAIRRRVFIEEQAVPEALEWDGLDDDALHLLVRDPAGQPVACARMLAGGRIGRMAVLPLWRKHGIGRAMLTTLIALAREQGLLEVTLSAQTHAIPFYSGSGFAAHGPVYDDAGIPHRDMTLALSA